MCLMDLHCIFVHFPCGSCVPRFAYCCVKNEFFVFEVTQADLLTLCDLTLADGQWLGSSCFLLLFGVVLL